MRKALALKDLRIITEFLTTTEKKIFCFKLLSFTPKYNGFLKPVLTEL